MKHAIVSVLMTVVLVLAAVFSMSAFDPAPEPAVAATATPLVDCQIVVGPTTRVVCTAAGIQVLNTVLDLPTVTLPPLPQATVTLPGATVTAPAPPRATQTVRVPVEVEVPGPTSTVTVNVPREGATATVTLPPAPGSTVTETVRPNGVPVPTETVTATATATETTTETPTGQSAPESDTVEPSTNEDDFLRFDFDLGDESVSAGEAGIGLLGALLMLLLIVAGMMYGFNRGRVSAEEGESDFLRNLLDRNKTS